MKINIQPKVTGENILLMAFINRAKKVDAPWFNYAVKLLEEKPTADYAITT